jgi:hypothetical protein
MSKQSIMHTKQHNLHAWMLLATGLARNEQAAAAAR